jgi:beta-lactamase class A
MLKIKINALYLLVGFILVLGGGIALWQVSGQVAAGPCARDTLLNQHLECAKPPIRKVEYTVFKKELSEQIELMQKAGDVQFASVYFRDLNDGPTFGINEKEAFIPASLLKVPVMLTYFKQAEEDPALLNKTLAYSSTSQALTYAQTILPEQMIELDKPYTIDELIFRMIAFSDNRAYGLLIDYLKILSPNANLLSETYTELGMINPEDDLERATLSTKTYASMFRLLYNASYLSNTFSQKALEYLASAAFAGGLRAGVPEEIPIAHKFGEHRLGGEDVAQLHDCGIVYYPENPYLLCIMTRGENFEKLSGAIATLSRTIYDEVTSRSQ